MRALESASPIGDERGCALTSAWHGPCLEAPQEEIAMLQWALTCFVLALIAGVVGLTGLAGAAANIAWVLFVAFLVLMIVAAAANAVRGRPPV